MKKVRNTNSVKAMAAALTIMTVCGLMSGCGSESEVKETKTVKAVAAQTAASIPGHKEADLKGLVEGLDDHYILKGAKGIDYLYGVKYDKAKEVIKDVKADSSKVKTSEAGKYEIVYTVTVDDEKLEARVNSGNTKPVLKTVSTETAADGSAEKGGESEIEVKKDIEVVDEKKAKELTDKGEEVWTDNNKAYSKTEETSGNTTAEDGTKYAKANTPANSKKASSAKKTQAQSTPSAQKQQNQQSQQKQQSQSSSGQPPKTGEEWADKLQVQSSHTHQWMTVEATGHYEEKVVQLGWDEPIFEDRAICNQCGLDLTDMGDSKIAVHLAQNNHNYSVVPVQTGTVHHDTLTQLMWVPDTPAYEKCSICGATR